MSEQALDTNAGGLTPAENAFFESKGETPIAPAESKPDAKPEGDAKPDSKPEGEGVQDKVEKVVPLAALHEERGKRKTLEQQLRERDIALARFEERFKLVEESTKPKAEPIDRNADPFAYINQVGDKAESLEQKFTRLEQQEQARTQQQQLLSAYSGRVEAFKKTAPDFDDAYKVAITSRQRAYELAGHPNPALAVQMDEFQFVTAVMQAGKDPAEAIYEMAKASGYQPKAKADEKPAASDKLDAIEKGQASNKTLGSAGGGGGPDEMTAEKLMKMPMDEFTEWTEKNPAKSKRLMGG